MAHVRAMLYMLRISTGQARKTNRSSWGSSSLYVGTSVHKNCLRMQAAYGPHLGQRSKVLGPWFSPCWRDTGLIHVDTSIPCHINTDAALFCFLAAHDNYFLWIWSYVGFKSCPYKLWALFVDGPEPSAEARAPGPLEIDATARSPAVSVSNKWISTSNRRKYESMPQKRIWCRYDLDLWPLTLTHFSAMATQMLITVSRFTKISPLTYENRVTRYRCSQTDGRTDSRTGNISLSPPIMLPRLRQVYQRFLKSWKTTLELKTTSTWHWRTITYVVNK